LFFFHLDPSLRLVGAGSVSDFPGQNVSSIWGSFVETRGRKASSQLLPVFGPGSGALKPSPRERCLASAAGHSSTSSPPADFQQVLKKPHWLVQYKWHVTLRINYTPPFDNPLVPLFFSFSRFDPPFRLLYPLPLLPSFTFFPQSPFRLRPPSADVVVGMDPQRLSRGNFFMSPDGLGLSPIPTSPTKQYDGLLERFSGKNNRPFHSSPPTRFLPPNLAQSENGGSPEIPLFHFLPQDPLFSGALLP